MIKVLDVSGGRSFARPASPRTLLPWLGWKFSLLLPLALFGLAATLIMHFVVDPQDTIAFRVVDDASGNPVSGARVSVGTQSFTTDTEGVARIPSDQRDQDFTVASDGFAGITGSLGQHTADRRPVRLTLAGIGGDVAASLAAPADPQLAAANLQPVPGVVTTPADGSTPSAAGTALTAIEGSVTSEDGTPIQGARVTDGAQLMVTGEDGIFALDAAKIDPAATIRISASGYADGSFPAASATTPVTMALTLRPIKAIYMNPNISDTEADVDRLIEIVNTSDANAIVLDIKEEVIYYDSQVKFFRDAGTVRPIIDIPSLLKKMHDNDIYVIARLVVFKDSIVAEQNPDLAVLNNQTGGLWRDMNGVSWVNPMVHKLWEVNTDLALEAATLGFDEIQYDYIRFPTDGDLSTTEFGIPNIQETREASITKFLEMSRKKLLPTGVKVSADVFGYTLLVDDDLGIGQNFIQLADYVDYLSPMVYPSHFPNGSVAVDGHPNDFPYETIDISMRAGKRKLDGTALQIRPWLQDFNYFDLMPYGDAEVRAQIEAAEKVGTSGWMLWDPNNRYHPGGFPEKEQNTYLPAGAVPGATPAASGTTGGASITRGRGPARPRRP